MKNKIVIIFIIFLFIPAANLQAISKTEQIKCLKSIIDGDIKKLGTSEILYSVDIIDTLNRIKSAFNSCLSENINGENVVRELESCLSAANNLRKGIQHPRSSGSYSNRLEKEFNKLIFEIEDSLEEMRRKDKKGYLREILNNEVRRLDFLSNRADVLNTLESIRDQLADLDMEPSNRKNEILTKLGDFIKETDDFSATNPDQNENRSKSFSAWLQTEFGKLIRKAGGKLGPQQTPETGAGETFPSRKTPSIKPVDTGEAEKKMFTSGGDSGTIVLIVLLSIGLVVGLIFLIKKFGKEETTGEVKLYEKKEESWLQTQGKTRKGGALMGTDGTSGKHPLTKDDIFGLKREMTALKEEVAKLKTFVGNIETEILTSINTKSQNLNKENEKLYRFLERIDGKILKEILYIHEAKVPETPPPPPDKETPGLKKQDIEGEPPVTQKPKEEIPFPKANFFRDWQNQIVEGFNKNKDLLMDLIKKSEKGGQIKNWIISIGKMLETRPDIKEENFFMDYIFPGLDVIRSKISKSEYERLKEVFLNSLLGALGIEEFGRVNEPFASYMHHLLTDTGGTGNTVRRVCFPGYRFKSSGKVIMKADVEL